MKTTKTDLQTRRSETMENRHWLMERMNPYFFVAMKDEPEAMALLEREMGTLRHNQRLVLADRENMLIQAMPNIPGSLYDTLRRIPEQEISYALIAHSEAPLPGMERTLEIQRFEFNRKSHRDIQEGKDAVVPSSIRVKIAAAIRKNYPDFAMQDLERLLRIIWLNNENYVRFSWPDRVAQVLNLFQKGNQAGGLYLDVEEAEGGKESRIHFAVGNPPQKDFLLQIMEVFNRLDLGVNRAYCLTLSNGIHPYFLGTFYVRRRDGEVLGRGGELFSRLQDELFNTQVLATASDSYRTLVTNGVITGKEGSLINALISFCHTNLAHNQPDRFGLDDVRSAFLSHPEIALQLTKLFCLRFDPAVSDRAGQFEKALTETGKIVAEYNTGHRFLDEIRRGIFRCALIFIRHTLKTNYFVMDKQALAFRLDPAYLAELGSRFTGDLPQATPFRVTFFFSRFGFGYHIGFSDIARGGWRTVIARTQDDLITNSNTIFRENFVLAHTQHLKNKDIYEGGSKMVVLLDVADLTARERELEAWRLYKLQYGITNAFLDIFVTRDGVAEHPGVVDYYREDEAIEVGPDENMHDSMIEAIARLSDKRGYILGIGIMSSKEVGINHKEFGVTSTGVVRFAEITMEEMGVDMRRNPFSVKFTGGPNGDVAGNAMRIMLERYPKMQIRLILDGTAALFDLDGASHGELGRILLKEDLDAFNPQALHPGGFMLFRSGSRSEGLRTLYRKVTMGNAGVTEEWISIDEFSREFGDLIFDTPADLFIPGGGRPETIDANNWERFFLADGTPSARAIIEGANSFITPEARTELQKRGVIIMRDASANKCGVISSSYEIIANLLMGDAEFLANKKRYVEGVLAILEKRAEDEARLILKRHRDNLTLLCTEISDAISTEINGHYARLFKFFQGRPELHQQPLFRRVILAHLPRMIGEESRYRRRIGDLPQKYRSAILAAELASSMVYRGDIEAEFEDILRLHAARNFTAV